MKIYTPIFITILCLSSLLAHADDNKTGTLIYDPQSKKYFIGGSTKFTLKPTEQAAFVDKIEISVDGSEYQSYNRALEFKEEGKHTLKFRASNPVNSWSPVQYVEVFVDVTAPTTEAKFPEEKYYKDQTGTVYLGVPSNIDLIAQDNLSGVAKMEYSWDGVNFTTYHDPIKVEKPGKQKLFFRSMDRVGNLEQAKSVEFVADNTPPKSILKLSGPRTSPAVNGGKKFLSDSVAYAIEATGNASGVKNTFVIVDGKMQHYIKPIYFLNEGPHSLSYFSVDNIGNKEEPQEFTVDTVSTPAQTMANVVGKVVNTGGINYTNPDFHLELVAKDNVVGAERVEVRVDEEKEFRPYSAPISFTTHGQHTVYYRSVDRVGNVEPAKTYNLYVVDKTPETTINTAQSLITTKDGSVYSPAPNVITLNVTDTGVGVNETLVSINDGAFVPYKGPITLNNDKPIYKVSYKSVDKLGNEEAIKTNTYQMMRGIPTVDLFVTNAQGNEEEKVRTNYLDHSGPKRMPAAEGEIVVDESASVSGSQSPVAEKVESKTIQQKAENTNAKGLQLSLPADVKGSSN